MSNKYDVVIGIEIHIELNTKTKMFSSAPVLSLEEPNIAVSPIDLAYPGALPLVNKEAIVKAIKLAKALKMKIADVLIFDRKNYFYPDLPKGYQITQFHHPIGIEGILSTSEGNIEVKQIQLEEDTAKSFHRQEGTFLDYNRAGVPLIEIITHPVIKSAVAASSYVETVRDLAQALDISDAKMENGSMRVDVNISLKPQGSDTLGTKVEIKNMNSIANIQKAIENEIIQQSHILDNNEEVVQTTKRFDEKTQTNVVMRVKGGDLDYKYFREPNIPNILLEKTWVDSIKLPELPWEKRARYLSLGISVQYIDQLIQDVKKYTFFDAVKVDDYNLWSKIFFAEIVSLANNQGADVLSLGFNYDELSKLISKVSKGEISSKQVKDIIPILFKEKTDLDSILKKFNFTQIVDETLITNIINNIIDSNKDFVLENTTRLDRVNKFVVGMLMKETKGQVNPQLVVSLTQKLLEEFCSKNDKSLN